MVPPRKKRRPKFAVITTIDNSVREGDRGGVPDLSVSGDKSDFGRR
jgi:hypothetical protein